MTSLSFSIAPRHVFVTSAPAAVAPPRFAGRGLLARQSDAKSRSERIPPLVLADAVAWFVARFVTIILLGVPLQFLVKHPKSKKPQDVTVAVRFGAAFLVRFLGRRGSIESFWPVFVVAGEHDMDDFELRMWRAEEAELAEGCGSSSSGDDAALKALIVVDEPHRKFMPGGEMRARHKHVIVHMTSPFAHKKVQDWLAGKSVKGFFSFNLAFGMIGNTFRLCIAAPSVWLCGRCQGKVFAAYCTYFFEASHKKLVSDIDQDP
ncbi:hypothetical protein AK812_SmicGene13106 [Symbiodinium microadriaticum]|uniref:Uncharacterized protein n=1 Tax=Symbiodinium microadriaticum TaxID=2951 RepID=A0A1Q9E8X5_SYMMI|nr:hypothetical protein AK812_SmicGene13106 [Symbiodinium microadriaticum]